MFTACGIIHRRSCLLLLLHLLSCLYCCNFLSPAF